MRIIAGRHRGTALVPVGAGDAAAHLRPTTDRVRESLFNVLQGGRFGERVRDARVLDLFAGTGALGLEALSRGAAHATFVDSGKAAQTLIAGNIARIRRAGDCTLLRCDANALPAGPPCDLVFLDPPYDGNLGLGALLRAQAVGRIADRALIVWEERSAQIAPQGFTLRDSRRYGGTVITIMERA